MAMTTKQLMKELQKRLEQEHQTHKDEIMSLKSQLEKMANEMQEMEKELAEKEATTIATIEKLAVAKERQTFLKTEIRFHHDKACEKLVAFCESEKALARERNKTADLHRKLEEQNKKLAEYSWKTETPQKPQAPPCEKDVSTQSSYPSTHNGNCSTSRWNVDQDLDLRHWDEGWTAFRRHRGYCNTPVPDNQ